MPSPPKDNNTTQLALGSALWFIKPLYTYYLTGSKQSHKNSCPTFSRCGNWSSEK